MLCDELKVYVPQDGPWGLEPEEGGKLVEEETCYLKSEVDAAIAELKKKLEDVQASMYADVVDANMEIRRLKRALYNLRACYANMMQKRYIECKTDWWVHQVNKWIEVERRCLNKAEEY